MAHCSKCGQLIPNNRDADWLLDILTNGTPHREVYHGRDGGWFVTYGGGEISFNVVRGLIDRGLIVSVYSDCPLDAYHVGRTMDIQKTMDARKKHGKGAPAVYIPL